MKSTNYNGLIRLFYLTIALLIIFQGIKAQHEPLSLERGSIENRFNYVIRQSSDYEDFKMVKRWMLNRLRNIVTDTLAANNVAFTSFQTVISDKEARIDSLLKVVEARNIDLQSVTQEKDSINFLTFNTSKSLYNTIMWGITTTLVLMLLILLAMYKRGHSVTRKAKGDLASVKVEFEAYRKKALEREQKVVRELYDEILKYKAKVN